LRYKVKSIFQIEKKLMKSGRISR